MALQEFSAATGKFFPSTVVEILNYSLSNSAQTLMHAHTRAQVHMCKGKNQNSDELWGKCSHAQAAGSEQGIAEEQPTGAREIPGLCSKERSGNCCPARQGDVGTGQLCWAGSIESLKNSIFSRAAALQTGRQKCLCQCPVLGKLESRWPQGGTAWAQGAI